MSEFVGIVPAGGEGSRLGLPYPKELHSVEPGLLYIDYTLLQFARAGIKKAYVVVSPQKLSAMASALMYERHGVELKYVETQPTDSRSLVGSVLRGCKRANYQDDHTKFAVALPDTRLEYPDVVKELVSVGPPCFALFDVPSPSDFDAVYGRNSLARRVTVKQPLEEGAEDYAGIWGAFTLDYDAVIRLRKLLRLAKAAESGDHHLMGDLLDQDIQAGNDYYFMKFRGEFLDLGEWERIRGYVSRNAQEEEKA